jgi:uncharacterized hydrophobic protein (TIGR00341 family)
MRLVQIFVPVGMRKLVLDVLDSEDIGYSVVNEANGERFEALVQFPISAIGVELVLEKLREAGLSEDAYKIVLTPETVISSHTKILKKKYSGMRISREELISRAEELAPDISTYLAFIVLSTIMATGGLLLDSAAIVIGAMVVAPLMGPAISASVGTVLNNKKLVSRGVELQVVGLLVAIAVSAVIGVLLKGSIFLPINLDISQIPQIAERTNLTFISLFLALSVGVAGAISIIRSTGTSIVGVAIAIALIPPAAASGLGIAWMSPEVAIPATILVLVNLLAINVSALIILWISGFHPSDVREFGHTRSSVVSRIIFIVIILGLLSTSFAFVTYTSIQTGTIKKEVNDEMTTVLKDPEYASVNLTLSTVTVDYGASDLLLKKPVNIAITINRRAYQQIPQNLASKAGARLTNVTGREFKIKIGFVEVQTYP